MAGSPVRRASDGAAFSSRLETARTRFLPLLPLLLIIALVLARAVTAVERPTPVSLTGAASDLTPTELKAVAADVLETATSKGGSGYTFEIVQTQTIAARAGGPLVEIPDPNDRHKSLGEAESYQVAVYIERGAASPDGFWLEIRDGPAKDEKPDFEGATYQLGTIVRDGGTWRNDGDGWYPTDRPPGLGLDPRTAELLPTMLRGATDAKDVEARPDAPEGSRGLTADTKVADLPGIIAVDAEAVTELIAPLEATFDDAGRLTSLHVLARNTTLDVYDFVVDTTITFAYPSLTPDIPKPDPLIDPDATKGEG